MAPKNLNVLVMDDHENAINLLESDLYPKKTGVNLFKAKTPETALSILQKEDIGTAFIDRYQGLGDDAQDVGVDFILTNIKLFPNVKFYLHSREDDPDATKKINMVGAKYLNKSKSDPIDYILAVGFSEEEAKNMGYRRC
jgi:hypothetical protein